MRSFIIQLLAIGFVVGSCFLAMAIGLMLRGKIMRGGCSSHSGMDESLDGCGACPKKQINLCKEDDDMGLSGISALETLGRYDQTDPKSSDQG